MDDMWVVLAETWTMGCRMIGVFNSRESAVDWAHKHQNSKKYFDATVFRVCDVDKE